MSTDLALYRGPDGVFWFGNEDQGVVPLAPSVAEFLEGFKASLRFAAQLDEEDRSVLALSLDFVGPLKPSEVEGLACV